MKTAGTQIDILYKLLKGSVLTTATPGKITGDIYKYTRPNSKGEDIVIHSLSLVGQSAQYGSAAVNIWIPDLDKKDQYFPDTKRIETLSSLALELIKALVSDDYNVTIANQNVFAETDIKYHFFSITVNFEFFNFQ